MNVWERKCGCDPTDHVKMFWWLEWGVYWTMRKMTPTEMIRLDQIQTTHGAKKIFAKNKKKEAKCAKLWNYQNLKIRQGKREDRWILIGIKREPIVVGAERERSQRWLNFQRKLFKCGWTFEQDRRTTFHHFHSAREKREATEVCAAEVPPENEQKLKVEKIKVIPATVRIFWDKPRFSAAYAISDCFK